MFEDQWHILSTEFLSQDLHNGQGIPLCRSSHERGNNQGNLEEKQAKREDKTKN